MGDSFSTDLAGFLQKLGWAGWEPRLRPSGGEGSGEPEESLREGRVFVTCCWLKGTIETI